MFKESFKQHLMVFKGERQQNRLGLFHGLDALHQQLQVPHSMGAGQLEQSLPIISIKMAGNDLNFGPANVVQGAWRNGNAVKVSADLGHVVGLALINVGRKNDGLEAEWVFQAKLIKQL